MDFKDLIKQITDRCVKLREALPTEEATKNALIMPFISALGWDVFNPMEVLPEMTCDIGAKKGEKIDYAILVKGEPVILIECKHWQQDLNLHDNQLLRYFNVSKAKFGILTNGIIYRFYTDLLEPNKMDEKPFLEINMMDLKDIQIEEIKKFHKSYFDVNNILSSASELKYMSEIKKVLAQEFIEPDVDFVKFIGRKVYDGSFTQKMIDQFTPLIKRAINSYISDTLSDKLKAVMPKEDSPITTTEQVDEPVVEESKASKIITTEEELDGYYLVKGILRNTLAANRITYRDSVSYFSIFVDNNNRKPICRLYLNSPTNKRIGIMDANKAETIYKIETIDDIFQYAEQLIAAAKLYE